MKHPDQRVGLRRGVSVMLVLIAHVVLIGAALQWGKRAPIKFTTATLEAMSMELTLVPLAPPAPLSEAPPGPPQLEPMHLESEIEHLPEPKLLLHADLKPLADLDTPSTQENSAANKPSVEQTTSLSTVNVTPANRDAARQDSAGSSSDAMVTWQSLLLGHLERFKRYPRRAERQRQQGVVYVLFSVDRQGNVRNGRLGQSSGYAALDDETLAVVQRANPVPPPPPEIVGDPIEVMVPVSFYLRKG